MTERKPKALGFSSWVDQQIADAERRGVFDDLPGAGKPLNIRPGGDYGDMVARWRAARQAAASASSPADAAHAPADGVQEAARKQKQPRWWRRRR